MMKAGIVMMTAATIAATGFTGVAEAQSPIPISAEVRLNGGFPRGALEENAGASPGLGYGVNVAVQLVPNYAIYGGYSRTTFDLDVPASGRAVDSGFAVGLTRGFELGGPISPYVGVGLLVHDLEIEGDVAGGGDSQLGFEFGGGVAIPVAQRIRITPGIGYRQYSARILGTERETVSIFSAGVGLNVAF
jgi:opacity protein-like surface antigen